MLTATLCRLSCTLLLVDCPSGLTNLTLLSGGFNRRADVGKYMPVSLVELQIGSAPHEEADAESDHEDEGFGRYLPPRARGSNKPFSYALAHLTAVTSLDFLWEGDEEEWEALYLGDELPPNTRVMWAAIEHGAATPVLHPLTELTFLDLRHDYMQASQLQSLSVLRKLEVSLVLSAKPGACIYSGFCDQSQHVSLSCSFEQILSLARVGAFPSLSAMLEGARMQILVLVWCTYVSFCAAAGLGPQRVGSVLFW